MYARTEYDGEETDEINERRYNVLKDQLDIYAVVRNRFNHITNHLRSVASGILY